MNHSKPRIRVLATLLLGLATVGSVACAPAAQAQEKNVVVHLGSFNEDMQSALMALNLANNLQNAGATVTIYLDRNAVRMAETRQPLFQFGDSDIDAIVSAFLGGGGRFLVCGHCARLAGVETEGLRSGFIIGGPEDIVAMFMAADIVIDF